MLLSETFFYLDGAPDRKLLQTLFLISDYRLVLYTSRHNDNKRVKDLLQLGAKDNELLYSRPSPNLELYMLAGSFSKDMNEILYGTLAAC